MSYCLNPDCQSPQNPSDSKVCSHCGAKLLLGDRYRSLKHIGQGGFGRTFLAVDEYKPSKPRCVIKQFFPQFENNNSQKAAELFEQEALRLDELGKHPQIPELLAHFSQDGQQYLVQEFIDGENLAQELADEGYFTEIKIRELLNSLLPVLQFIHNKQIIHRDIKPENIIRSKPSQSEFDQHNGRLVLVDLGAAKYATGTALESTGTRIGDPRYIAPEQLAGRAIFASDIYSLGVTCIHLLTDIPALDLFDDGEATWIWRDYLKSPVSKSLGIILDKMLESATKRRYQSPQEVIKDLNPSQALSQGWRCIYTLNNYAQALNSLAFSPDSKILASSSTDNTIKLWQTSNGKLINSLVGHSKLVRCLAFSPNGEILASGSADHTIKLWQTSDNTLSHTLSEHSKAINCLAFSPNREILASSSSDNTIKLWHFPSGLLIRTLKGHLSHVNSIAFSPDGEMLASASSDHTVKFWHVSEQREIRTLNRHNYYVHSVAFSPDGDVLASGSWDGTIKLWEVNTGKQIQNFGGLISRVLTGVYSIVFSKDGQTLVSSSTENTIKLWEPATGTLINTLNSHSKGVVSVAFSPDGEFLATGSFDKTIKVWRF